MKNRSAILFAVILCAALLVGCNRVAPPVETLPSTGLPTEVSPSPNQNAPDLDVTGTDVDQSPVPANCQYSLLKYSGTGVDVDLPYLMNVSNYAVKEDSGFIASVWDTVNYASWAERDTSSTSEVSIRLEFYIDNSEPLVLEFGIDDVGWCPDHIDAGNNDPYFEAYSDGPYYTLPPGTYDKVSKLLADYTVEHYSSDEPSIETVDLFAVSFRTVTFAKDPTTNMFLVSTAITGDFVSDWELDKWEPYSELDKRESDVPMDSTTLSDFIHIQSQQPGTEGVTFGISDGNYAAVIKSNGVRACYKIPESVYHTIERQFDEFQTKSIFSKTP